MLFPISLLGSIPSVQCYLTSLLGLSTVAGDFLVVNFSKKHIYRALFDNTTHAIIGGLTWFMVCLNHRNKNSISTIIEICVCTAISSLIDLDHFITAKSLSLKDAVSLKNRPVLHCTTVPLIITPVLLLIAYICEIHSLQRYSLIIFTAFITHHTRDAARRGYWLYPFGSTKPIPYMLYVLITLLIPYVIDTFMRALKFKRTIPYSADII